MRQLLSGEFASEVIHSLRGLLPVAGVSYYAVDEYGHAFGHQLNGLPLDHLREYRSLYHRVDPLHPSRHAGDDRGVVTLEQACRQCDGSKYVAGFLNARGYFDEVELFFRNGGGAIVLGIGLLRGERDGRFRASDVDMLARVKPVIELAIRSRLRSSESAGGLHTISASYELTRREVEIVALLRRGASNREIADRLDVSVATVKSHLFNAFKKTGTTSRTDLLSRLMSH